MKTTIDMAREAGAIILDGSDTTVIDRLVALVRADQREIDAKVCDDYDVKYDVCSSDTAESIAAAIRARGNT
jgi:hypothetical protein